MNNDMICWLCDCEPCQCEKREKKFNKRRNRIKKNKKHTRDYLENPYDDDWT